MRTLYFVVLTLAANFLIAQSTVSKNTLIYQNLNMGWGYNKSGIDGSVWFFRNDNTNSNLFYAKAYTNINKKKNLIYSNRWEQYIYEVDCSTKMYRILKGEKYENGLGRDMINYGYNTASNRYPSGWEISSYGTVISDYISSFCQDQSKISHITEPVGKQSVTEYKPNGTGFLITSNLFVTNNHVVASWQEVGIKLGNDIHAAKILITDKSNDISILQISDISESNTFILPFGIETNPRIGENVFVLGYPLTTLMGNDIKISNGIINSLSGIQGNATEIQISVPVQPGNSGSPVFNESGNIIGIITSGLNRALTENVSYAVKSTYLKILIDTDPNIIHKLEKKNGDYSDLSRAVEEMSNYIGIVMVK